MQVSCEAVERHYYIPRSIGDKKVSEQKALAAACERFREDTRHLGKVTAVISSRDKFLVYVVTYS